MDPLAVAELGASDRAALQGLIPLAGALGAGTIFALFFGSRRRRAGFAVFEIFAIVAVLAAVATTAFFALALLHQDQPVTDRDLTQTATPLVVAVFLLVFISASSRLSSLGLRAFTVVLPLAFVAAVTAAALSSLTWSSTPDNASLIAFAILAFGGVLGLLAWIWERHEGTKERRELAEWFARIAAAGYEPGRRELLWALPSVAGASAPTVSLWTHGPRVLLDRRSWARLGAAANHGWDALAQDEAQPPAGRSALVRVEVRAPIPVLRPRAPVRVTALVAGATEVHDLAPNDDRLFDVTDLGLVGPARS